MRSALRFLSAGALGLSVACGGSASDGYVTNPGGGNNNPTNPTTPTSTNAVAVSDNQFSPSAIQVTPGTTVTWTWASSSSPHNVIFSDGGSQTLGANATYTRAFATAGTYNYQCTLHAGMSGSVTVR